MNAAEFGQIVTGGTGVLLLVFAGYGVANLRFRVPGTAWFVALTLAAAIWCFGYAVEKAQTTAVGFMASARLEYAGLAFAPWLWFLVALNWMEHPLARARWLAVVLLLLGLGMASVVWTNNYHHWWYAAIVPTDRVGFARFIPGPLYYPVFGVFASPFVLSSLFLFIHRRNVPLFRQKAAVILSVNLYPLVFALAFQFGVRPSGLDPTIFSLVPSFATLAWGLFRHDFIRIVPVARDLVVESMDHPVLVFDRWGRLVDHNPAATNLRAQVQPERFAGPEESGELSVTEDGDVRWFRYRKSPLQGVAGQRQGTVVLLTDVTEQRRLLDELSHQASHDSLTGLPNRRHFEDHARGELTRAGRHGGTVAMVLFDLDWFKAINDQHGHPAGDRVLQMVAHLVGPRLRPYDLLARLGGEEFVVLMPEVRVTEAREAAERWRAALEGTPVVVPGALIRVTASFGVATLEDLPVGFPDDAQERLDALMGIADKALYQAKAEGRNRVV